jgi:PTH1 family peptidyl-tRNA hydrolase
VKRIVVGLGNPGSRYEKTRHNMGWLVLDRLAERTGSVGRAKARDGAASVRGRLGELELILVKPTTYMNLSGAAVRKVLARERAPLEDMLVVLDEMSLPFGRLRVRERGSAGGHNGLRSIIGELGTEDFARLRVGIGAPQQGAVDHVLGDFAHAEQGDLDVLLDAAADAVETWARAGASAAANRWNAWLLESGPKGAPETGRASGSERNERPRPGEARAERRSGEPLTRDQVAPERRDRGVAQNRSRVPDDHGVARDPSHKPDDQGIEGTLSDELDDERIERTRSDELDDEAIEKTQSDEPDDQGIVRTQTGWRRLLPEALRGRRGQGQP